MVVPEVITCEICAEYRLEARIANRFHAFGPRRTSMLIDVSHVVEHGMITSKGLPAPLDLRLSQP